MDKLKDTTSDSKMSDEDKKIVNLYNDLTANEKQLVHTSITVPELEILLEKIKQSTTEQKGMSSTTSDNS